MRAAFWAATFGFFTTFFSCFAPGALGAYYKRPVAQGGLGLSQETLSDGGAFAVTGTKRHPGLPNVPTVAEAGMPDFKLEAWVGLFAPAATPPAVANLCASSSQLASAARSSEPSAAATAAAAACAAST